MTATWQGKERRQSRRIPVTARVNVLKEGGESSDHFYYTRDLSVGGLYMVADDPPSEGTLLTFELAIPGVRQLIPIQGKVLAHRNHPEPGAGIQFVKVKPVFEMLIQDHIANWTPKSNTSQVP